MPEPLRALLWAAVSSKPQTERDSNEQQLADATVLCERRGWIVVVSLTVPGHSRNYGFYQDAERDMPEYARLRDLCAAHAFDVLVCRGRDRLGRTDALIAQVEFLVSEAGAQIYSMTMPSEPTDETGQRSPWLSAVERARAQSEVSELRRRNRAGVSARAKRGYFTVGRVPFGYRKVKDLSLADYDAVEAIGERDAHDLVIHHAEADVVRAIHRAYLAGASMRALAFHMRATVGPAPAAGWNRESIRRILTNPIYAGRIRYGQRPKRAGQPTVALIETPGRHTAIIPPAEFDAVQALIASRYQMHGRAAGSPHLFSGLLRCTSCGSVFGVCLHRVGQQRVVRYRCVNHDGSSGGGCTNRHEVGERQLRDMMLSEVTRIASSPAEYDAWREARLHEAPEHDHDVLARERDIIDRGLTFWNRQAERGVVTDVEWLENRRRLLTDRERVNAELARVPAVVATPTWDEWRELAAHPDDAALRAWMLRVVRVILIGPDAMEIHYR